MFIRESRWSRLVAAANVMALLAVVAGYVVYRNGYYPTTLRYRIVDESFDANILNASLADRRPEGIRIETQFSPFMSRSSNQFNVRAWAYQRSEIVDRLEIEEPLQVVWLATSNSDSQNGTNARSDAVQVDPQGIAEVNSLDEAWTPRQIVVAPQVQVADEFDQRKTLTGTYVRLISDPVAIQPSHIAKVNKGYTSLTLEFSPSGRQAIESSMPPSESVAGLGIVVDEMVQCLVPASAIDAKGLSLQLQQGLTPLPLSATAIEAAVRGPAIPAHLELLK